MANENTQITAPTPDAKRGKKRRGVVLIAVLVVIAALSLAAYHYSDMMTSEFKASEYSHRNVQARAFAESGYFTIIAPPDPDDSNAGAGPYYGVSDEGGKINLNAMMKVDPTGQALMEMLVKLPNMTPDVAANIVAWLGGAAGQQSNGANNDAYMTGDKPYRVRGGPIDSVDELLLVRGVTRQLLYGSDLNRNGVVDLSENNAVPRGWCNYLTVHSREQNVTMAGKAPAFLNNANMEELYNTLNAQEGMTDDLAKFIVMYRQNGGSTSQGKSQSTLGGLAALFGGGSSSNTAPVKGTISNYQLKYTKLGSYSINSIFDLVDMQVTIKSVDPKIPGKVISTLYKSPLSDESGQPNAELLNALFAIGSIKEEPEWPARINVNTAPREVLMTIPGLADTDVQKIIDGRKAATNMSTLAWLLTDAQVPLKTLQTNQSTVPVNYMTTRSQVYRAQSIGYFEGKGPVIRIEAVIDTNNGRPRILAWRDLSELGKGLPENAP
ncbi:MAG: general secretion pathway protein GspK [Planctomycetes bacterium]|nr:general secretion pathway protein GspK [Planctomycetota bacterium]